MDQEAPKPRKYNRKAIFNYIAIYVGIGLIVYGLFYYFSLRMNPSYTKPSVLGANTTNPSPNAPTITPNQGISKITVTATDFAFTPSTFYIKGGMPLEITFVNNGTLPHNLSFIGINESTDTINPGQQTVLTFTPTKGSYDFICTVPGHADKGMKGTMIIQ